VRGRGRQGKEARTNPQAKPEPNGHANSSSFFQIKAKGKPQYLCVWLPALGDFRTGCGLASRIKLSTKSFHRIFLDGGDVSSVVGESLSVGLASLLLNDVSARTRWLPQGSALLIGLVAFRGLGLVTPRCCTLGKVLGKVTWPKPSALSSHCRVVNRWNQRRACRQTIVAVEKKDEGIRVQVRYQWGGGTSGTPIAVQSKRRLHVHGTFVSF
jgi:hypothetical protein